MLTEGWDANTVTHILGVRAFGTQLLCEQVTGRALRRQSYDLNEEGLFDAEYADILGIPFNFNAKPVVSKPQPPRETVQVRAVRPERDHLEIRFPRVTGYRVELPETELKAEFNDDSRLVLTPDLVGPTQTEQAGIIGETANITVKHLGNIRASTLLMQLTKHLLLTYWRDSGESPQMHLFPQLKRITRDWLDNYLDCQGDTKPAQLMYQQLADMACQRITDAITRAELPHHPVKALLDAYNPGGSTRHVRFSTTKTDRWETIGPPPKCHLNWVILDSDWEAEFCRIVEAHPRVRAYAKNHNLGLEVPYLYQGETHSYLPDFILKVDDGHGEDDLLNLIVEIKGYRGENAKDKKATMETRWIPGINHLKTWGRWAFAEFTNVWAMETDLARKIAEQFDVMLDGLPEGTAL
jgi:type III restriction enzyme